MSKRVLVAAPRSFCAGVVRAIDIVEKLLEQHGPPVYVRHEIVHNVHVVQDLQARGAVFVESETDVPAGATLVLSAHGVAPSVYSRAAERRLHTIDATCPLVTKVHVQARRYAADGHRVVLIGHAGHEEVVGTMGEAPEATVLVESELDRFDGALHPGAVAARRGEEDVFDHRRDRSSRAARPGENSPAASGGSSRQGRFQCAHTKAGRIAQCSHAIPRSGGCQ